MPDKEIDPNKLEDFDGGSKQFRRKANSLVAAVRGLQAEAKKGKRSPLVLYLETDSIPIAVEIDATVLEQPVAEPFLPNLA